MYLCKRKMGRKKGHPQTLGPKGKLLIFEFESAFFSLGRSTAFDLKKVFFRVVHLRKFRPLYPAVKPLVPPWRRLRRR